MTELSFERMNAWSIAERVSTNSEFSCDSVSAGIALFTWEGQDGLTEALSRCAKPGDVNLILVSTGSILVRSNPDSACAAGRGCLLPQSLLTRIECPETTRLIALSLPCAMIETLLEDRCKGQVADDVRRLTQGTVAVGFELTPDIKSVAYQLLKSGDDLHLRALLRVAKAYEVLSLSLERLCPRKPPNCLSCCDVQCLENARRILETELAEPPSLIELARQVGINDFKLKKGFKALFKTTPYSYLTDQRMMVARRALAEEGDASVTEVANRVGYTNLGHFAAAFRKRYGVAPREFRRSSAVARETTNSIPGLN